MSTKEEDEKALRELDAFFTEVFEEYILAKISLDRASMLLKRLRSLIALKPIYDLILRTDEDDVYIRTERMMSKLEEGGLKLRMYIEEIQNQNSKAATKNPSLNPKQDIRYH